MPTTNARQAVHDAWYGTSKAPVCFEVQPINRVPANIADGSYDLPSLSVGDPNNNPSINSDGIVAKQSNGAPYPKFQLVPYEGCGGNCIWQPGTSSEGQGSTEDCFNSECVDEGNGCEFDGRAHGLTAASGVRLHPLMPIPHPNPPTNPGCYGVAGANQNAALQCDFAWAAGDPTCVGMYTLWGGGSWPNSGGNFGDYSAAYAINYAATFPAPLQSCEKPSNVKGDWYKPSSTPTCQFANWCNGINMHHDWTFAGKGPWYLDPYRPYPNITDPDAAGPATQFGGDPAWEQIMFRYRHVPCRNWHDTLGAGTPYPNISVSD